MGVFDNCGVFGTILENQTPRNNLLRLRLSSPKAVITSINSSRPGHRHKAMLSTKMGQPRAVYFTILALDAFECQQLLTIFVAFQQFG